MTMRDFIAPVKGIVKALDTGTKLAKRVSKATTSVSGLQALQITESAKSLQESLEECSRDISDAYNQVMGSCGVAFTTALLQDVISMERLKELRIDIIDHTSECPDYDEDESYAFNQAPFTKLEQRSHECAIVCLEIFNIVRDRVLQEKENTTMEVEVTEERSQSGTTRPMSFTRKPVAETANQAPLLSVSPDLSNPIPIVLPLFYEPPAPEPIKPASTWALDSPTLGRHYGVGSPPNFSLSSSTSPMDEESPSARPDGPISREIRHQREVVKFRVSANEEFLEKRRRSKISFQNELRKSVSSFTTDDRGVSPQFSDGSFSLSAYDNPVSPVSPIVGQEVKANGRGYDDYMMRQRSQTQVSRASITSSMAQSSLQRSDSQASEESLFGLRAPSPLTPPLVPPRNMNRMANAGNLATTLQLPDFGKDVEPGIEVVNSVDHENGLMLASEGNHHITITPAASVVSVDQQMRHDSSFFKLEGFCEGAKIALRGETCYKQVKRPAGNFSSIVSAKCVKCSYEAGWNTVEQDLRLDLSGTGIHGSSGIRYRQRFLWKSHVKTNSHEDPLYACVFCVEARATIEPHDATIFFSAAALARHLAKHAQPAPQVNGLHVIYGAQPPTAVDFDMHFPNPEARITQYPMSEIAAKVNSRPSAHAITTNHFKLPHAKARDPEGNPILHFAAGARIVGVSFPERFQGQWCMGYHDGDRGAFPASCVTLDLPRAEDVLMNAQSTLVAWAKWDFKPKDVKEGGWIGFKKGERISCVGYAFQDQWCWSGRSAKGKWGLFPSAFVEELRIEQAGVGAGVGSPTASKGLGFGARIAGGLPLGKKKSATKQRGGVPVPQRQRSGSLVSMGSVGTNGSGSRNGRGSVGQQQPGLEIVNSLVGGVGTWNQVR